MSAEPKNRRKAILLLNVGTPDKPEIRSVRKYLSEFLNDPFVIDLPWLFRKILVNLIIVHSAHQNRPNFINNFGQSKVLHYC